MGARILFRSSVFDITEKHLIALRFSLARRGLAELSEHLAKISLGRKHVPHFLRRQRTRLGKLAVAIAETDENPAVCKGVQRGFGLLL